MSGGASVSEESQPRDFAYTAVYFDGAGSLGSITRRPEGRHNRRAPEQNVKSERRICIGISGAAQRRKNSAAISRLTARRFRRR
jgi:hypothetical protein